MTKTERFFMRFGGGLIVLGFVIMFSYALTEFMLLGL